MCTYIGVIGAEGLQIYLSCRFEDTFSDENSMAQCSSRMQLCSSVKANGTGVFVHGGYYPNLPPP